jgi:signal transduction histidine kinase
MRATSVETGGGVEAHASQSRSERLIATGRAVLAAFSLLAIWLDPSQPALYAEFVHAVVVAYVGYAFVVTAVAWRSPAQSARLLLVTHILDLAVFAILMHFTEGPISPFFVLLLFSLLCAALRWQWRGTVWTAGAALVIFVGMGAYETYVLRVPGFELNTFLIRTAFLIVVAALLGSLAVHEQQVRREMSLLAAWTRPASSDASGLVREVLDHAAGVLAAPRAVGAWEEREEPWMHVASWSGGEIQQARKAPGMWDPLIAPDLSSTAFLCPDAAAPIPVVHHTSPQGGLRHWQGAPLHPGFQTEFAVGPVLSAIVVGETLEGRLFWLDKTGMSADDLFLAGLVAHQAAARMDYFYLLQQRHEAAAAEERVRVARDLHDGLLQSLTAAALQLQAARVRLTDQPDVAREQLLEVQRVIATEQRELRAFIQHLKPVPREPAPPLGSRLDELVRRVEKGWGLHVRLRMSVQEEQVRGRLADQACLMIHEALVNATRHGQASAGDLAIATHNGNLRITVADNGHGFAFRGRYDHAALMELRRGPVSLKERVLSLGGSLVIESSESGARVEITVPLPADGA